MNKVIAVDFDGTLCVSQWPEIGEENYGLIEWLKECRSKGDKVILFTCREDDLLDAAELIRVKHENEWRAREAMNHG